MPLQNQTLVSVALIGCGARADDIGREPFDMGLGRKGEKGRSRRQGPVPRHSLHGMAREMEPGGDGHHSSEGLHGRLSPGTEPTGLRIAA